MAYKVFTNGSQLPASDVNTYLMNQAVMTFATASARAGAIPAPTEGMLSYLEDLARYEYFDGNNWTGLTEPPLSFESASFSLVAGDKNSTIVVDSASDVVVTVDDVLAAGQRVDLIRKGTGNVSFLAGSGVTLNSKSGWLKISDRYSAATVIAEGSGVYYLIGSLSS